MENKTKEIQSILSGLDKNEQMKVIIECASKVGTQEWKEAIDDLMKRMGMKENE
jgi:hypothetical protein